MKVLNSRSNKMVLEERLTEARQWNRKLFRELILASIRAAPDFWAILQKFIFHGDSLTLRQVQSKCSTVPAGNRQIHPSSSKCDSNCLTVEKFLPFPSFARVMNNSLKCGISWSNWLTTNFKSGLIASRQKRSTKPSPTPRGWLETTSNGQPVGIFSNPLTLILFSYRRLKF